MTYWQRAVLFTVLSIGMVFGLGRLPVHKQPENLPVDAGIFTPTRIQKLTNDTVVDAMESLALKNRIARIDWDADILTVDLVVAAEENAPVFIWQDTGRLVQLTFGQVANVKELLIRYYIANGSRKWLLASADTRLADWQGIPLADELTVPPVDEMPDWLYKLRFEWTASGKVWFGNFAN